jgi:hypothetical protein
MRCDRSAREDCRVQRGEQIMPEATYQVRISGVLPADLLNELPDLTVRVEPPETVLHGSLPDQSAVVGLISRIHGLGLHLIEVRRLPPDDPPPTSPGSGPA